MSPSAGAVSLDEGPGMSAVMRTLVRVRRRLRLVAALRGLGEAALLVGGMLLVWATLHRVGALADGETSPREILGHRGH